MAIVSTKTVPTNSIIKIVYSLLVIPGIDNELISLFWALTK